MNIIVADLRHAGTLPILSGHIRSGKVTLGKRTLEELVDIHRRFPDDSTFEVSGHQELGGKLGIGYALLTEDKAFVAVYNRPGSCQVVEQTNSRYRFYTNCSSSTIPDTSKIVLGLYLDTLAEYVNFD